MTVTRTTLEKLLVKRASSIMTFVGMSTLAVGSNDDLNDPIGYGLRQSDLTVADHADVVDGDVANVTDALLDQVLDIAELRLLKNILGNLDEVDLEMGPRSEEFSQIADRVEGKIERLEKSVTDQYGVGLGALSSGIITQNFAQHNT